jgi:hypothetical protein
MAPPTIFQRPKRQIASSVGEAQLLRVVSTEDDLLQAITEMQSTEDAPPGADYASAVRGGEIVIAAPIAVRQTIVIPEKCIGLTIRSAGLVPLVPQVPLEVLFYVDAIGVVLDRIFAFAKDETTYATIFAMCGASAFAGDRLTMRGCVALSDRLWVDGVAGADDVRILDNEQAPLDGVGFAQPVFVRGERAIIRGNKLSHGGAESIMVDNAGRARIVENSLNGGDIETSGGTGLTIIANNVDVGSITSHASDIVGDNT